MSDKRMELIEAVQAARMGVMRENMGEGHDAAMAVYKAALADLQNYDRGTYHGDETRVATEGV